MGNFVCTDESLSDEERFRLKWGDKAGTPKQDVTALDSGESEKAETEVVPVDEPKRKRN